jgi:SAM-dependent methyltransferase
VREDGRREPAWDQYAPFYDWENARTIGRRDVPFWRTCLARERGPAIELGCGTGRLLLPLARTLSIIGLDRSAAMLARARERARRLAAAQRPRLALADVRALPFPPRSAGVVLAAYGLLQCLLLDRDLDRALAETARVLRPNGLFGVDLVPELASWAEHGPQLQFASRARNGARVSLIESVRRDRLNGLTMFHERFVEQRGRRRRSCEFTLTFRTRPMPTMIACVERAGFRIEAVLGDYLGGPWHDWAETWLILARKQ